ncbi:hypothetical protein V1523DRAFT_423776 [Lipomyces doorenjongii]
MEKWLVGTMVPLYSKPNYGDRFFDRKHNYSFNIQARSLTISSEYSGGGVCFTGCMIYRQREQLLMAKDEWCWADCGYPLYDWLPLPYRKPDKGAFRVSKSFGFRSATDGNCSLRRTGLEACIILHNFALLQEKSHGIDTSQEYIDEWARINGDTFTDEDDDDDDAKARADDLRVGKEMREFLRDSLWNYQH